MRFVFDHHDLCPELYLARFGEARERLAAAPAAAAASSGCSSAPRTSSSRPTSRTAQVAITRGGERPERVFVVRSGPSRERFATVRPVDAALKRGQPLLVAYLGVMAPQDGVDHLLRAARRAGARTAGAPTWRSR